jgi:hypothetical protein
MSLIVGVVTSTTGRYTWAIWSGWAMTTLGFALLYLLNPNTSIPAFIFLNVPVAIGTGSCFVSMSLGIQAAGRPQDAGHCVTFYSFIRVFGQSLGVAAGGVIFQNQVRWQTSKYPRLAPLAGQFSQDATAVVSLIKNMEAGTEKTQLIQAYADSLKTIWLVMAVLSGAVLVSTAFVKGYSMNQKLETLQGFDHGGNDEELRNINRTTADSVRPDH